ncbi:MAG: glyoxalase [Leptolyngbyaceae cyanobacterium SM2_5_2]|nr:glyoxalase [Leptolyngbyaceae cyanobacterium SM2_5_2]
MISIQAPLHVALNVSNLALAEAFYGGILGLTPVERPLSFPGLWYQVGEFQIHLIVAEGYQIQPRNLEKWGRNAHLALAVENLAAAKAALVEAGYPMQTSASGRAALFTQDTDGNILELSQAI